MKANFTELLKNLDTIRRQSPHTFEAAVGVVNHSQAEEVSYEFIQFLNSQAKLHLSQYAGIMAEAQKPLLLDPKTIRPTRTIILTKEEAQIWGSKLENAKAAMHVMDTIVATIDVLIPLCHIEPKNDAASVIRSWRRVSRQRHLDLDSLLSSILAMS